MTTDPRRPLAVYHEHPDWFQPLLAELDRRGLPYVRIDPRAHVFDPGARDPEFSLFFNRMSPSAPQRDGVQGLFFTRAFLAHLERLGVPLVNGRTAFTVETSKALQLTLLESLGLSYPRARVFNHPAKATAAADGLRFPVVVKANVGGGAGIVRFDSADDLARAAAEGRLDLGVDHTALAQEYVPPREGRIARVETLGGKFLYAIHVYTTGDAFNLCPADAPPNGLKVEAFQPPESVVEAVELIVQKAGIDVGGVEYLIDDRDGRLLYYNINALSHFVADAVNVVGFDPFARLVDYLEVKGSGVRGQGRSKRPVHGPPDDPLFPRLP